LPDDFTTNQAIGIANEHNIAERTLKYFIADKELFNNFKRGFYQKRI